MEIFHVIWYLVKLAKVQIVCIRTSKRTTLTASRSQPQTETVKRWGPRLRPWDPTRDSKTRIRLQRSTIIAKKEKITLILAIWPLYMEITWCISLNLRILMHRTRLISKAPHSVRWHSDNPRCQTQLIVLTWNQHIQLPMTTVLASKMSIWTTTIEWFLKTTTSSKATVLNPKIRSSK